MNVTDNNNTYVVKLDELDLNYFYLNFPTETTSPLWNTKNTNFGNYEYCQFKVEAAKLSDSESTTCLQVAKDPNDASNINLSTYSCLLCNVNIPIVYRSEHKNSPKHKIYIKIAQIALERSKNLLTSTDDGSNSKATLKTIFCEACAIAVNVTDKKNHDLSKTHQKSLLHDRFLNDLFMIYEDSVYLDHVNFKYLEDYKDAVSVSEEAKTVTEGALSVTVRTEQTKLQKPRVSNNKPKLPSPTATPSIEAKLTSTTKAAPNSELKPTNQKVEQTYCQACKIYIDVHNFRSHGFGWMHKVNSEIFKNNVQSAETQPQNAASTSKIANNLSNSNTLASANKFEKAPTIDVTATATSTLGKTYCKPCRIYIDTHNLNGHSLGRNHKMNLNIFENEKKNTNKVRDKSAAAASKDNNFLPSNNTNMNYCEPCQIYIHINNSQLHISGKNHKMNLDVFKNQSAQPKTQMINRDKIKKETPSNDTTAQNEAQERKQIKLHYLMQYTTAKSTLGKTYCKPCRIYIDTHNLNVHSLGRNHKMNLNIFENEKKNNNKVQVKSVAAASKDNNFLPGNNSNMNYCEPCQIHIHINNLQSHTLGKKHKMNLDVFKNQNSADTPKDSTNSAQPKTHMSNTDKIKNETPSNDTTAQNEAQEKNLIKLHYLMRYYENDIVKCKYRYF